MKSRLKTMFNLDPGKDYEVVGEPRDTGSAHALWEQDPFQFQFWAVSLLEAQPQDQQKRGADRGIDGLLYFIDGPRRTPQKVVVQVKGGGVQARDIREVIQAYHDSLENFGKTKSKFIKASHNNVKRAVARALTQLVQPDFPTFTVSAQKQISLIKERVIDHYDNLEKMWREADNTSPFPLKWPEQ